MVGIENEGVGEVEWKRKKRGGRGQPINQPGAERSDFARGNTENNVGGWHIVRRVEGSWAGVLLELKLGVGMNVAL